MGYRIDSYTRDELKKIALPGKAVSTLFWVLPIGKWGASELDKWWFHFTQCNGLCQELGLLLAKNEKEKLQQGHGQTANLQKTLSEVDGGSLLDLIPEAKAHHSDFSSNKSSSDRSLLILSGSWPQPGWGVLMNMDRRSADPHELEELLNEVIGIFCDAEKLQFIKDGAKAYHEREKICSCEPTKPKSPPELDTLRQSLLNIGLLIDKSLSGNKAEIDSASTQLKSALDRCVQDSSLIEENFWADLNGYADIIKVLPTEIKRDFEAIKKLWNDFLEIEESERDAYHARIDKRQSSLVKNLRFLHRSWPDLRIDHLPEFLEGKFRSELRQRIENGLETVRANLQSRFDTMLGAHELATQQYEKRKSDWQKRLRDTEQSYRKILAAANASQWELGPRFLLQLENIASRSKVYNARSIAWDPARMIGWKLHISIPGHRASHLLRAAKSVMAETSKDIEISQVSNLEFNGSVFADYAHYVSISAVRMNPWEATCGLIRKLLSPRDFDAILETEGNLNDLLLPAPTDKQHAEILLGKWGWKKRSEQVSRPILRCLKNDDAGELTLAHSPNETRIAFESFLKDLLRISLATLGWNESDIDLQLSIHCPEFGRKKDKKGCLINTWPEEVNTITAGAANVLLGYLLKLAFTENNCNNAISTINGHSSKVTNLLNAHSHDTPAPPLSHEESRKCGKWIKEIVECTTELVGELPWHLRPAQTYGSDPLIVTGHAWSHSHEEERLIRVMVWAGNQSSNDMLVWNKTLTNPVMTDAILI
jgi:hypothetical protein